MKRIKIAGIIIGGAAITRLAALFALGIGSDILQQFIGSIYGVTAFTILLSIAFALIIWFVYEKRGGKK